MATHRLAIPGWHPARINQFAGRHWGVMSHLKRQDREAITYALITAQPAIPRATGKRRVSLAFTLAPRQRRWDPDATWKSLLDALVCLNLLVSDSDRWCEMGSVTFDRGSKRCTIITLQDL